MTILGICGSLKTASKNASLLGAFGRVAPAGVSYVLDRQIGRLPLFNPDLDDLDHGRAPEDVLHFRRTVAASAGVIICSPEYARGVSGVMKNALDWLVGSGEFLDKPTVLLNASPGSLYAHAALAETLRTMSARVIDVSVPVAVGGPRVTEDDWLERAPVRDTLPRVWHDLMAAVPAV